MIPNNTRREALDTLLTGETLKVALIKDSTAYSPDKDNHDFVDDVLDGGVTAAEYDDTNYSRQTLSNVSINVDDTNDRGWFDADNTTFPSLGSSTGGQTVQAILVYIQGGADDTTPGDDRIVMIRDDGNSSALPKQTNGEDFVIEWSADGLVEIA